MSQIILPTLHQGQIDIFNERAQLNVVCCGRRFGKTKLMVALTGNEAAMGRKAGLFTPEHKQLQEPYDELRDMLEPIIKIKNKTEGRIRTINGGHLDFWATTDNPLAGRGREYHIGCMDEAAFSKDGQMLDIWKRAMKPTLLTTKGRFWLFSTPNGVEPDNFFYQAWHDPDLGFKQHYAPTSKNPYVPPDELEKERLTVHPLVWKQEFLAEFVSWDSATFFKLDYFLDENKEPVGYPDKCDGVFAVLDCSVKSGSDNDGTAVLYCAVNMFHGIPLVWLDWDLYQIEAASLEFLAPKVLARCEELAKQCQARNGSLGMLVEDAAGGSVLIQQGKAKGWPIKAIDSKLLMKGKDERAMIAGGPAFQGKAKISRHAFDKVVEFKGRTQNHLIHQLTSFRVGDKEAYRRSDDALDVAVYSIIMACSDQKSF